MKAVFRVIVLGEGKDESGKARTLAPFSPVPHARQGAMELLVRRAVYPLLNDGQPWHRGLTQRDGIDILQPPPIRLPRAPSMVEVLADPNVLALLVSASLRPAGATKVPRADLLVATHDAEGAEPAIKAIAVVNASLRTEVPLLLPAPEIQAWLTRKRAIELAYDRQHCSVPEPDEAALKRDAKAELIRLLGTFGGKFDARMQARMAEFISNDDLGRYDWTGWGQVSGVLKAAIEAKRAHQAERVLGTVEK
jgi:hypothetical protein